MGRSNLRKLQLPEIPSRNGGLGQWRSGSLTDRYVPRGHSGGGGGWIAHRPLTPSLEPPTLDQHTSYGPQE